MKERFEKKYNKIKQNSDSEIEALKEELDSIKNKIEETKTEIEIRDSENPDSRAAYKRLVNARIKTQKNTTKNRNIVKEIAVEKSNYERQKEYLERELQEKEPIIQDKIENLKRKKSNIEKVESIDEMQNELDLFAMGIEKELELQEQELKEIEDIYDILDNKKKDLEIENKELSEEKKANRAKIKENNELLKIGSKENDELYKKENNNLENIKVLQELIKKYLNEEIIEINNKRSKATGDEKERLEEEFQKNNDFYLLVDSLEGYEFIEQITPEIINSMGSEIENLHNSICYERLKVDHDRQELYSKANKLKSENEKLENRNIEIDNRKEEIVLRKKELTDRKTQVRNNKRKTVNKIEKIKNEYNKCRNKSARCDLVIGRLLNGENWDEISVKLDEFENRDYSSSEKLSDRREINVTTDSLIVSTPYKYLLNYEMKNSKMIQEEARIKAEEEARIKAEEEARIKAEEEARIKAEEEASKQKDEEKIKSLFKTINQNNLEDEEEKKKKDEENEALKNEAIKNVDLKNEEEERRKQEEEQKRDQEMQKAFAQINNEAECTLGEKPVKEKDNEVSGSAFEVIQNNLNENNRRLIKNVEQEYNEKNAKPYMQQLKDETSAEIMKLAQEAKLKAEEEEKERAKAEEEARKQKEEKKNGLRSTINGVLGKFGFIKEKKEEKVEKNGETISQKAVEPELKPRPREGISNNNEPQVVLKAIPIQSLAKPRDEEERLQEEEEARKQKRKEEEEAKLKAIERAKARAEQEQKEREEARRKKEEEERKQKEEEEARLKAEEEAKLKAEQEAARKNSINLSLLTFVGEMVRTTPKEFNEIIHMAHDNGIEETQTKVVSEVIRKNQEREERKIRKEQQRLAKLEAEAIKIEEERKAEILRIQKEAEERMRELKEKELAERTRMEEKRRKFQNTYKVDAETRNKLIVTAHKNASSWAQYSNDEQKRNELYVNKVNLER